MVQNQKMLHLLIAETGAGDNPRCHTGDVENAMPPLLAYYFLTKIVALCLTVCHLVWEDNSRRRKPCMACTSLSYITCRFDPNGCLHARIGALLTVFRPLYVIGPSVLLLLSISLLSSLVAASSRPPLPWVQYGVASWYGVPFHGRLTANGERYNMYNMSAAHQHAPLGIHAIVTHLETGRMIRVRINDRGPFVKGRVIDLSYGAARRLGMIETGLAPVKIEFLPTTQPPLTFIVQAGAYQDPHNAKRAEQALRVHYSNIRISAQTHAGQRFYRIHIGPFATRAEAEQVNRQLHSLGYHALILPQS
jgi:rare lipoprotein A